MAISYLFQGHNLKSLCYYYFLIRRFICEQKSTKTHSLYKKGREKDIRPWRVKKMRGQRKEDGNNV